MSTEQTVLEEVLGDEEEKLIDEWLMGLRGAGGRRRELLSEEELRQQAEETFRHLRAAVAAGDVDRFEGEAVQELKELIAEICRTRVQRGFSPRENALFLFTLKRPLVRRLREKLEDDPDRLFDELWRVEGLLDELGLWAVESYQRSREQLISRQQEELLELSTPVVKLWRGIVALPLIGTLDSSRAQVVMETLLERIVETSSEIAILDITGVSTVDTLVAQHLLKTVSAARLMGAECIISGIRPQIAQTIVQLGVDLEDVVTKGSLADAFSYAVQRIQEREREGREDPS